MSRTIPAQAARRPKGTGSKKEIAPGKWRIRWVDSDKAPREQVVYGTGTEADVALNAKIAAANRGEVADDRSITVGDWLEEYLALVKPGLAKRSFNRYARPIHLDLVPAFGKRKLVNLDARHLADQIERWQAEGRTNAAINWRINLLRMAIGRAVPKKVGRNVAREVSLLPHRRARHALPSDEALDAILIAAQGHPYELVFAIAIGTGMRPGEILALRWADVDFFKRKIEIRLNRIYGTDEVKETKSEAGDRFFPMPVWLRDLLVERRGDAPLEQWVITTKTKRSADGKGVWLQLQKVCAQAGVPVTNYRQIRHYAATRMLEAGVPIAEVQKAVGHASITMTVDTYGHVTPGERVAAAMERRR